MNILQVITPKRLSGAERVCVGICRELRDRGHRVEVATKPTASFIEALEEADLTYHPAPIAGKFTFASPWRIARLAQGMQADIIHTHLSTASLWGSYAGWICHTPVVAHMHALNTAIWYRFASRVVAVAGAVRDHAVAHGVQAKRTSVVYNAVEIPPPPSPSDVAHIRREIGVPADAFLIAIVAHLTPKKGHAILLETLSGLTDARPDIHCVCLGEGRDRDRLEEASERLGLSRRVSFLGFRDDCRQIVGSADVVVLPSLSGEGLPLCILEAAALGKPVIGSRLSGIPEVVLDGVTGYTVDVGDPDALGGRIRDLHSDADLRARMGEAAREMVAERFSVAAQVDAIEAIYQELLDVSDLPATTPDAP